MFLPRSFGHILFITSCTNPNTQHPTSQSDLRFARRLLPRERGWLDLYQSVHQEK